MSTSGSLVAAFTHLKDKPRPEAALALLQRVASLVKPIMRKHDWKLPVLAEFFPGDPALQGLNVNRGQKICLRLRTAGNPHTLIDVEQVVLVMLHELTHNVHGPHDQHFYKFLSGLEAEWEALKHSGYSGEGFYSVGRRVGVGVSHDLPMHRARVKAAEAAERRAKQQRLLGGPGRALGGSKELKSPRELAAEAAERRARDERSCASGAEAIREAEKAAEQSISVAAGGESSAQETISVPSSGATTQLESPVTVSSKPVLTASRPTPRPPSMGMKIAERGLQRTPVLMNGEWECPACTLVNKPLFLQCMACQSVRPRIMSPAVGDVGWTCLTCGEGDIDDQFWSCRSCGSIKTESAG